MLRSADVLLYYIVSLFTEPVKQMYLLLVTQNNRECSRKDKHIYRQIKE